MHLVLIALYLGIGASSAVFLVVQRRQVEPRPLVLLVILMLVFWPFLLPSSLGVEPVVVPVETETPKPVRSPRMQEVQRRLDEASSGRPERAMLAAFLERLCRTERSLGEMERVLRDAPAGAKDKLERLRGRTEQKLQHDLGLLEEVITHLTVLRFAELDEVALGDVDESRVFRLLAEIKALVELSAEAQV